MITVTPFLWYDNNAIDAAKFYCSIFKGSKILEESTASATVKMLGQTYILFNGGPHYKLTPATSLFVLVKTQKELDHYWSRLLDGGQASRCGWLVDRFGLSWQVIPQVLGQLLGDPDYARAGRAMEAMLKMVKLDVKALVDAANGDGPARRSPAQRPRSR